MKELTLRPATPADEATLAALARRLTAFELPAWRAPREISEADAMAMTAAASAGDPDNEVLIAERDGTIVGCLHVLALTDFFGLRHGHVSVIATTESAEGSGVARTLIEHAERWTTERGLPLLTLNMFAGNARARRVLRDRGVRGGDGEVREAHHAVKRRRLWWDGRRGSKNGVTELTEVTEKSDLGWGVQDLHVFFVSSVSSGSPFLGSGISVPSVNLSLNASITSF